MRDNIGILVAAILGVMLLIILPLLSILERQDNMTYNVALTLTSNFADEVKAKGYIDKDTYENYLKQMSKTGAIYDYDFEAYKTIIIPTVDEEGNIINGQYTEDKLVYNKVDIEREIYGKNKDSEKAGVFVFDVGDEFYIKVKNNNIPSSSLMYKFISGESNTNIVNISCGGVINSVDWERYEASVGESKHPTINIGLPTNNNSLNNDEIEEYISQYAIIPGSVYEVLEGITGITYYYAFNTSKTEDRIITLDVELTNFKEFAPESEFGDELLVSNLLEYIQLNNFEATVEIVEQDSNEGNGKIDAISEAGGNKKYNFQIRLSNIITREQIVEDASVTIKHGLGKNEAGYESSAKDSEYFRIISDIDTHSVTITGPFVVAKESKTEVDRVYVDNTPYTDDEISQEIYFKIKYTAIAADRDTIIDAIEDNLLICYGENVNEPSTTKTIAEAVAVPAGETEGIISDCIITDEIYDGALNYGTIKVTFKYYKHVEDDQSLLRNPDAKFNFIALPDRWIDGVVDYRVIDENGGYAKEAYSKQYNVLKDDVAPVANVNVLSKSKNGTWIASTFIEAGKTIYGVSSRYSEKMHLEISDIKDIAFSTDPYLYGSGIAKIGISLDGGDYEWQAINGESFKKELDIPDSEEEIKIYIKYMDFSQNISDVQECIVRVLEPKIDVKIEATKIVDGKKVPADSNVWHNEPLTIVASAESTLNYELEMNELERNSIKVEKPNTITMIKDRAGSDTYRAKATIKDSAFFDSITKEVEVTYHIDDDKPFILFESPRLLPGETKKEWLDEEDILAETIEVFDRGSGLQTIEACISNSATLGEGEKFEDITPYISLNEVGTTKISLKNIENMEIFGEGSLDGSKYVHIRATDKAGNVSTANKQYKIDSKGPTFEFAEQDDYFTNITVADSESGLDKESIKYAYVENEHKINKDGTLPADHIEITNGVQFKVETLQPYIYIEAKDKVGHISYETMKIEEEPIISIDRIVGLANARDDKNQSTNLVNQAFSYNFGNCGYIGFEVKDILPSSKVYAVVTTDNEITINNVEDYIKKPEDEVMITETEKTKKTRNFTLSFKYTGNWYSAYSRYLTIIVKKITGGYVIKTIKITNYPESYIYIIKGKAEIEDGWFGSWPSYNSPYVLKSNVDPSSGIVQYYIDIVPEDGTGKIKISEIEFSHAAEESITVQYYAEHNGECLDVGFLGICNEYEKLYWKDIATVNKGISDFTNVKFSEMEFNKGQRIRVIRTAVKNSRSGGHIITLE